MFLASTCYQAIWNEGPYFKSLGKSKSLKSLICLNGSPSSGYTKVTFDIAFLNFLPST